MTDEQQREECINDLLHIVNVIREDQYLDKAFDDKERKLVAAELEGIAKRLVLPTE